MSNVRISQLPVNQPTPASILPIEVMTSPGVFTTSQTQLSTILHATPDFVNFESTLSTVTAMSAGWETAYVNLCAYAPSWIANNTLTSANSSHWNSTYNTVTAYFSYWQLGYTYGSSSYTTVNANSAQWQYSTGPVLSSVYTTVNSYSAAWQAAAASPAVSVYTTVNGLSAGWTASSSVVAAQSARWSGAFTNLYPNSSNWNSVYNYVYGNSATNNINFNDTRYINVTGGYVTGNLLASSISGANITTSNTLTVSGNTNIVGNLTTAGTAILNGNIQLNGDIYNLGSDNLINVHAGLSATELFGKVNRIPYVSGFITNHKIAGSSNNNYFIMSDGTIKAVGKNTNGELGHGSTASTPVLKTCTFSPNLRPYEVVTQIYCQANNTYVITSSGAVYGAGNNTGTGALNLGLDAVEKHVFTLINGLSSVNVVKLAVGTGSSPAQITALALTDQGKVWGWGWNAYGQLGFGRGVVTNASNPLYISPLSTYEPFADVAVTGNNSYQSSFVLTTNGTVLGCGYNANGVLGISSGTTSSTIWRTVTGLSPVTKMIPAGQSTASLIYYITQNGGLSGAGSNDSGALGNTGGATNITTVAPVTSLQWGLTPKVPAILFTGTFTSNSPYITNVSNASNLTIGQSLCGFARVVGSVVPFTVASILSTNPTTVQMNTNYPGTVTTTDPMVMNGGPLTLPGVQYQVLDIYPSCGTSSTTYALVSTGTGNQVWGWGYNGYGQLGQNNATTPLLTAVQVASNVNKFVFGGSDSYSNALILTNNNTLCAVGRGNYGQLGRADNDPLGIAAIELPVPVLLPPDAINNQILDIAITNKEVGDTSTNCFALLDNGKVLAWGGNGAAGELGTDYRYSSYVYEYVPRYVRFSI